MFVSVFVDSYLNATYNMKKEKEPQKLKIIPIDDDTVGWLWQIIAPYAPKHLKGSAHF